MCSIVKVAKLLVPNAALACKTLLACHSEHWPMYVQAGFKNIVHIDGGFPQWRYDQLPTDED